MALNIPGFCKRCGAVLEHAERPQGRAREFCSDACRKAWSREVLLRVDLRREVGLSDEQADRLLDVFHVSRRRTAAAARS